MTGRTRGRPTGSGAGRRAGRAPLVVVGDALLDRDLSGSADRLAPDAPVPVVAECAERVRPGGAALAAYLAARDGREVTLITGLGDDPAGRALRELLEPWLTLVPLPLTGTLPEKTRVLAQDRPVVRLDRGGGRASAATDEARAVLRSARAVLVSDYGRGAADVLRDELAARPPLVWDPHPRGGPPVPGTRLVTPAEKEAHGFAPRDGHPGGGLRAAAHHAAALVRDWRVAAVTVTLGSRGALLSYGEHPSWSPRPPPTTATPAARATASPPPPPGCSPTGRWWGRRSRARWAPPRPSSPPAAPVPCRPPGTARGTPPRPTPTTRTPWPPGSAPSTARWSPRAAASTCCTPDTSAFCRPPGGSATAWSCVNSDASVQRRKGEGRPVNPLADRVRVLRALACVDAVAVFDEDTPERLLGDLRPDVWVKGGDYAGADLPEAALLEEWGGQAVLLPYLDGRSSTALMERAAEGVR